MKEYFVFFECLFKTLCFQFELLSRFFNLSKALRVHSVRFKIGTLFFDFNALVGQAIALRLVVLCSSPEFVIERFNLEGGRSKRISDVPFRNGFSFASLAFLTAAVFWLWQLRGLALLPPLEVALHCLERLYLHL